MDRCGADSGFHGQDWFAVLPDHEAAAAVAERLPRAASRVTHHSGRPWLVGRWASTPPRVGSAGRVRLAVFGWSEVGEERLAELAAGVRGVADVPRIARAVGGCVHVVASVDGVVLAHGALSGLRRLFHIRVDGVAVAADRADVLAAATGSGVDERALAMRLLVLSDELPCPVDPPLWRGVTPVPEDSCLVLDRLSPVRVVRRWSPPDPVLTLAEGAAAVRTALAATVAAHREPGPVGADLSGGLDSTTVCFLAAREDRPLITFTTDTGEPDDEDMVWADRAAACLPGPVTRIVVPGREVPPHYADLTEPGPALDEPFPGVAVRAEFTWTARLLTARGARLRLTGDGGDEVLQDSSEYLGDLLRARPLAGARRLWTHWLAGRWPWWRGRRHLWPRRSARVELRALAAGLVTALPADERPRQAAHLPPWATPAAADLVADYLRDAGRGLSRPAPGPRSHTQALMVRQAVYSAHVTRVIGQLSAAAGLPMSAPFLADAVLDACLAVRPEERTTPWSYKPLLVEAMRGIVPERSLARRTKAEGSALVHASLREQRAKLLALCEESRLAAHGLVDPAALREACVTTLRDSPYEPTALSQTFSAERWLRDLPVAGPPVTAEIPVTTRGMA
ncbi:asparagine synthase-related protein [Saccharothrix obliqua]|uniref:asparagine synthase-related protein n=1 Tax=Saccharothrix obliqua TaxID=2861747 RepID=UPI001C5DD834|nr:asparagine synthase-related protein [Saccharothrix obliqua]MBW4718369.1 asparagine synthase [Saccharothrix obliqua]